MTWTYTPSLLSDPTQGTLMQTRLELGDTDSTDPLLTDEELVWLISSEGDPLHAAQQAALNLAAKFARLVDYNMPEDISEKLSQRAAGFRETAASIGARLSRSATPYAGGVDVSDVLQHETDTGLVQPYFERGEDEEPVWSDTPDDSDSLIQI